MKKIYWKMLISGNIEFINLTFWSHGLVISDITDLSNDNSRLFKLFKKSVVQYHLLRFSYSFQPCYLFLKVKQRQFFFLYRKICSYWNNFLFQARHWLVSYFIVFNHFFILIFISVLIPNFFHSLFNIWIIWKNWF